jgi:hypothetical protein
MNVALFNSTEKDPGVPIHAGRTGHDRKAAFARGGIQSPVPYLVAVIVERECDCSMGASIDAVRKFV